MPWRYGYKSAKSLVKIRLSLWQSNLRQRGNVILPYEYGFYANVNPNVDHPRWSQKSERVIGGGFFSGKQPTLMFNGYEKQVAHLYAGMELRKNSWVYVFVNIFTRIVGNTLVALSLHHRRRCMGACDPGICRNTGR